MPNDTVSYRSNTKEGANLASLGKLKRNLCIMRIVIQRVTEASVAVNGKTVGAIERDT